MSAWSVDGRRIDVPYPKDVHFICVEHPALVSNDDKALKTLGGTENVAMIYGSRPKRLPLSWRPEDAYSKPTFGDRIATTNILMKVKKRRRKKDGKEEYKVEILGRVGTTYKYQSMCDFQFLPVRSTEDGSFENLHDRLVITDFCMKKETYFGQNLPLFIPPLSFSRVDRPCDFLYRQDIEHREGYTNPDKTRPANLIGTVRQRRSLFTIFVNFGEKLPAEPLPQAVKKLNNEYIDAKSVETIRKLFEEKPLWLKVEVEHRTGFIPEKLKIYLPAMSFYWLDGPWRGQWNKFGYDPTKNPAAKIHQTLDFRMRSVKTNKMEVKAKRSDFLGHQWAQVSRNQKHNVKININALSRDNSTKKLEEEQDKEWYYKFKPGQNPPQRMMYYPIQYIDIDEVQELMHKNDGKEKICTERDGWCVLGFQDKCRDIMFKHIQGYESYSTTFWKHKYKRDQTKMTSRIQKSLKLSAISLEDSNDMEVDYDNVDQTASGDLMSQGNGNVEEILIDSEYMDNVDQTASGKLIGQGIGNAEEILMGSEYMDNVDQTASGDLMSQGIGNAEEILMGSEYMDNVDQTASGKLIGQGIGNAEEILMGSEYMDNVDQTAPGKLIGQGIGNAEEILMGSEHLEDDNGNAGEDSEFPSIEND